MHDLGQLNTTKMQTKSMKRKIVRIPSIKAKREQILKLRTTTEIEDANQIIYLLTCSSISFTKIVSPEPPSPPSNVKSKVIY